MLAQLHQEIPILQGERVLPPVETDLGGLATARCAGAPGDCSGSDTCSFVPGMFWLQ